MVRSPGHGIARLPGLCIALLLFAQPGAAQAPATVEGGEIRVFHLVFGPGDYVWEQFGHNALWIHDPEDGTDLAYNWGLFDFQQEDFLLRFAQGRMWYWMDGHPVDQTIAIYSRANRSVTVQELALDTPQKEALRDFLRWNALPENRFYLYDYFRDNCSTRVRDALDRVLDGQIRRQTEGRTAGTTYRRESLRLVARDIPAYVGIHVGLGPFTDREISVWDEMFIPMAMQAHLRELEVIDPETGERRPMVISEQVVFDADRPVERERPPVRLHWFLLVGVLVGGLAAAGGAAGGRRWAGPLLGSIAALWGFVAGICGLVLLGLWGLTDHVAAHGNANLLQLNPFAIGLVALVPLGLRGRARPARWAYGLAWALLALSAAGVGVAALLGQQVGEIVALAFPTYAGIALGLDLARRRERSWRE